MPLAQDEKVRPPRCCESQPLWILKTPGDVSEVISDPNKVATPSTRGAKETLSVAYRKAEIRSTFQPAYPTGMRISGHVDLPILFRTPPEILPCRHFQGEQGRLPNKSKTRLKKTPTSGYRQNHHHVTGVSAIWASGSVPQLSDTQGGCVDVTPRNLIPRLIVCARCDLEERIHSRS